MANNTINISSQNVTLASAQRAVASNGDSYFAVVSFYCASESGNRPNATGLTIKFDPRLTLINDEWGEVFSSKVYNSAGQSITSRGRGCTEEKKADNIYFAATAADEPYTSDGYLYFACVQFPVDVAVGDVFPVTIELEDEDHNPCEFLYVDSTASAADQAAMNTWTKEHGIINGGFTIVE